MSNKFANRKKLRKNVQIKNWTYPVFSFLERSNSLPYFQSIINSSLKLLKIKKQFNSELNYRHYAKLFKDSFKESKNNTKSTILIVCFHPVNSTIFLRQMMLAQFLNDKGHPIEFIACDSFFNICQLERHGKTRNDFKYLCHECGHHYKTVQKETSLPIRYLSTLGSRVDKVNQSKIQQEVDQLDSVESCENYISFDGVPLGALNKVGILRYFQQGQLEENHEILAVYKKYLSDTYRTYQIFKDYIKAMKIGKTILWSGSTGHENMIAHCSTINGVDFITQEMYIGNNSWIYKTNGVAIHLNYYNDWLTKRGELIFTQEQKEKILELFSGMKKGTTFSVSYNDSTQKLALDPSKKYAVLFTNMNFDMYVLGRNPIFESMKQWVKETIEFWRAHLTDTTLIIRAHPGEIKLVTASVDFISDVVELKSDDNIIFYDSNSDVNSYDLLSVANYVLTYSSTIGAEALLNDIPCISAGENMYQNFCSSPKTKNAYFDEILNFNSGNFPPIDKENLLNYLHFLMFVQNVEVSGFRVNRKVGRVEFNGQVNSSKQLLEMNAQILEDFYENTLS